MVQDEWSWLMIDGEPITYRQAGIFCGARAALMMRVEGEDPPGLGMGMQPFVDCNYETIAESSDWVNDSAHVLPIEFD